MSVYGAVGGEPTGFVFQLARRQNQFTMLDFLRHFLHAQPAHPSTYFIVLDNAGFHRAKSVKAFAAAEGIDLMFLPSYSSVLSPIERVWSMLK